MEHKVTWKFFYSELIFIYVHFLDNLNLEIFLNWAKKLLCKVIMTRKIEINVHIYKELIW